MQCGKRPAQLTENENRHLIKVGHKQPKLASFARNKKVFQRNDVGLIEIGIPLILIFNILFKTMVDSISRANCFCPGLKEKRVRVLG